MNLMFNPWVLSLCVFSNEYGINVIVRGFEAFDGNTRTNIGEQIKGSSERKVEGDMALANYETELSVIFRCSECRTHTRRRQRPLKQQKSKTVNSHG
jgi:hypothetical protein